MTTPDLLLQTLFLLDDDKRIVGTREPDPSPGPKFSLIRGKRDRAWAVRSDVPEHLAEELDALAREEPLVADFRGPPANAERYLSLIGDHCKSLPLDAQGGIEGGLDADRALSANCDRDTHHRWIPASAGMTGGLQSSLIDGSVDSGPAFEFPDEIATASDTVFIEDAEQLDYHFAGWTEDEIPYRTPIVALLRDGHAVSVCFCARRTEVTAEAGVETAPEFRGRGFATQVTAAWASAIRASGRVPLYSTSWDNHASLAVARKLGLLTYASTWSIL